MSQSISLPVGDAYQQVFSGFYAQLTAVVLGLFNMTFGGFISYKLVMDDIKTIEQRGTLVSRLWAYHDLILGTLPHVMSVPFILRVLLGPLNEIYVMLEVLAIQFVLFQVVVLYNEIFLVRILLAFWFKSAFAMEENFFLQFFMVLNFYMSSLYVSSLLIMGGYATQFYYFMLGLDMTFPWSKPLFNGGLFLSVAFFVAQSLYLVILVYRTATRIKEKVVHTKFKRFTWNIVKSFSLISSIFLTAKYRNLFSAQEWEKTPVLFIFVNFGTPFGLGVLLPASRYLEQVKGFY